MGVFPGIICRKITFFHNFFPFTQGFHSAIGDSDNYTQSGWVGRVGFCRVFSFVFNIFTRSVKNPETDKINDLRLLSPTETLSNSDLIKVTCFMPFSIIILSKT